MRNAIFEEKVELACLLATETGMNISDAATQVNQSCITVFEPYERWGEDEGYLMLVSWEGSETNYESYSWDEHGNLKGNIQEWHHDHLLRQAKSLLEDLIYGGPTKEAIITEEARDRIKDFLVKVAS